MRQRVLVTGHDGYIGSVMVPLLEEAGYEVIGLDTFYFEDCSLVPGRGRVRAIRKDIRDIERADLEGIDAIIHLAALSNDPIGNLNLGWTHGINLIGSVRLAELARDCGIQRFLFSSSCIMYGMSEAQIVDESSPLDPKTDYAVSKVEAERAVTELADERFSPTFLRNGTVYGLSPRMRLDTVLNELVAGALVTGKVSLRGDGTPWRPVVHVEDVGRSFLHVLQAPLEQVHGQAFNNGADFLNCRMLDLARWVAEALPGVEVELAGEPSADRRTYQADFGKFARTFPDFEFRYPPREGARRLAEDLRAIGFDRAALEDPRFVRLRWLRNLMDSGRLDADLHWRRELSRQKARDAQPHPDHRV